MKIESYKKLIVWQKSITLTDEIYKLTAQLPITEKYGLMTQMNRSVVSIPSNIAEGSRRAGLADYVRFLMIAAGSAAELETQVCILKNRYSGIETCSVENLLLEVQKMLSVLIKNLKSKTYDLRPNNAFTMVELLVAMSIFSIIISVSSGVFVRSLQTQRATIALIAANSNASLAIEQMTREMRTGSGFSGGGSSITFVNSKKETVTYRWNSGSESMALERSVDNINFRRITGDNVSVKNLNFIVFNGTPSDPYPWRITIIFRVGVKNKLVEGASVDLQTTVSSRAL